MGFRRNFVPGLPRQAVDLIDERDRARSIDPSDPVIEQLDARITSCIFEDRQKQWRDKVESSSFKNNPSKFWRLLKSLSGKRSSPPPNQPIKFGNKVFTKSKDIANGFVKQYSSVAPHQSDRNARRINRNLRRSHPLDSSYAPFTVLNTVDAIRNSKSSTAAGPDGLTPVHLKHLGLKGVTFLTALFNLSVGGADIPSIWKSALIIPVVKPGKSPECSKSFRPISLLCPAVKILERLILPSLTSSLPTAASQHGFKPLHSTTTALFPLVSQIVRGFNDEKPPRRTAAVSVDISKAFDSVRHSHLIDKASRTDLHPNLVRWLSAYLRGRSAACVYLGVRSSFRLVRSGVPQGSVISLALFNFFVADFPDVAELTTSFADDFSVAESSTDLADLEARLNADLVLIVAWADRNYLSIAPDKSSVTLFTSDPHQSFHHPQVSLNGVILPLERRPKILGVTLDTHLSFSPHIAKVAGKASSRLKILKALAGTDWGQEKETILMTFKSSVSPVFNYAAPLYRPNDSKSALGRLQRVQNSALHSASGCHLAASVDHLHSECKVLPVKDHLDLLCKQFLVSSLRPNHPAHESVRRLHGDRRKKETLRSKFFDDVHQFLRNDVMPCNEYKVLGINPYVGGRFCHSISRC